MPGDLFGQHAQERMRREAPLAARMRPRGLEEFLGQESVVGTGRLLRSAIEADRLPSMILYGPAGSGKTTLARIVAGRTAHHFEQLSAVTAGVADVRRVIEAARERLSLHGRRTILFIDEVHRFNKGQQDALLPAVEDGTVTLIGSTTQNPFFSVNTALVSRCRLFRLEPLADHHVREILVRALADRERGLGHLRVELTEEAREHLVSVAAGDARSALNALELAVKEAEPTGEGVFRVTLEMAADAVQQRVLRYDKTGDEHYDVLSAYIKSVGGSDPDAALYWLARMLEAGEDPRAVARRLIISASEDVGNADPLALPVAVAAAQAVEMVGLPEGRIPLAHATIYVAAAPKSNACYLALEQASADVRDLQTPGVPVHLRNASYQGARRLGHGQGYLYPHEYPGHHVAQSYLPEGLRTPYYRPTGEGWERRIARRLRRLGRATEPDGEAPPEAQGKSGASSSERVTSR